MPYYGGKRQMAQEDVLCPCTLKFNRERLKVFLNKPGLTWMPSVMFSDFIYSRVEFGVSPGQ